MPSDEALARKLYMSIGEEHEYLTTPYQTLKNGNKRKIPWNKVDKNVQDFYTEIVQSVTLIQDEE